MRAIIRSRVGCRHWCRNRELRRRSTRWGALRWSVVAPSPAAPLVPACAGVKCDCRSAGSRSRCQRCAQTCTLIVVIPLRGSGQLRLYRVPPLMAPSLHSSWAPPAHDLGGMLSRPCVLQGETSPACDLLKLRHMPGIASRSARLSWRVLDHRRPRIGRAAVGRGRAHRFNGASCPAWLAQSRGGPG